MAGGQSIKTKLYCPISSMIFLFKQNCLFLVSESSISAPAKSMVAVIKYKFSMFV